MITVSVLKILNKRSDARLNITEIDATTINQTNRKKGNNDKGKQVRCE